MKGFIVVKVRHGDLGRDHIHQNFNQSLDVVRVQLVGTVDRSSLLVGCWVRFGFVSRDSLPFACINTHRTPL